MQFQSKELTDRELSILESLNSESHAISQRELARRTGLSVGFVNAIIKKLIRTGYIKTGHLNHRSLEYLLTPQGFAHTALKSYHYIANTVRSYQTIQERLKGIFSRLQNEGFSDFYLHGDGELANLVAMFFSEEKLGNLKRKLPRRKDRKIVVLNATPQNLNEKNWHVVDLVKCLGEGNNS